VKSGQLRVKGGSPTLLFILYLVVCVSALGLINLAPLFSIETPLGGFTAKDIFLILLLGFSIPAYIRQRRRLASEEFRWLEFLWSAFIIMLAIQSFRSPANSLTQRLNHVRFVQPYLLFYPSIALLDSIERIKKFALFGGILAVLGTILTIAQSFHGLDNLFNSPFYDIGAWGGNKMYVGTFARVNLPISNWIAFVLLLLVAQGLMRLRLWHIMLGAFLAITIVLDFARSLWLAMAAAVGVIVLLYFLHGRLSIPRIYGFIILLLISVGLSLGLASILGFSGLYQAVLARINEGMLFFTTDTGTWGGRQVAAQLAYHIWHLNPLFGIGTDYYPTVGFYIDLGLPLTLVSIGIIGMILEGSLLVVCSWVGLKAMKKGNHKDSPSLLIITMGVVVPAFVAWMLVYQGWLDAYICSILAIASAISVSLMFVDQNPSSFQTHESTS
jgi:hypothetical protein